MRTNSSSVVEESPLCWRALETYCVKAPRALSSNVDVRIARRTHDQDALGVHRCSPSPRPRGRVDPARADTYFKEAAALCAKDGGRLWGTVLSADSAADATDDAIEQLAQAALAPTFVRTFAYASGAACGLLLDAWSPGWAASTQGNNRLILRALLVAGSGLAPTADAARAALACDGAALKTAEDTREVERQARVAELRRIFIERPVLVIPNGRSNSFATAGLTPIPGVGTIVPGFRTTGEWGTLEAATVLLSANRTTLTVPAPGSIDGTSAARRRLDADARRRLGGAAGSARR